MDKKVTKENVKIREESKYWKYTRGGQKVGMIMKKKQYQFRKRKREKQKEIQILKKTEWF